MTTETKPDAAADQAAAAAATNPQQGVAAEGAQPSQTAGEGAVSRAEFDALRKQNEDILKGMNEAFRQKAQAESERDIYQRQAQAAAGVVQKAEDPEAAAWKEFQDSPTPEMLRKWQDIHDRNLVASLQRGFSAQQAAVIALPRAQEILGETNPDRAAQILHTEINRPKTLDEAALLVRYREGKLAEWLAEDQRAKEWRSKQAALAGPMGMAGNGRAVPGQNGTAPKRVVIEWAEWAAANDEAKAAIRKDLNNPNVEYAFAGVPEALVGKFDPSKG